MAIADTSFLIALEQKRPLRNQPPTYYRISIITIAELRAGLLAADSTIKRSARLDTLTRAMEAEPLLIDDEVAKAWAELRLAMRGTPRQLKANDSWIAATAIAHNLPIVTQDNDYDDVPGLEAIKL